MDTDVRYTHLSVDGLLHTGIYHTRFSETYVALIRLLLLTLVYYTHLSVTHGYSYTRFSVTRSGPSQVPMEQFDCRYKFQSLARLYLLQVQIDRLST